MATEKSRYLRCQRLLHRFGYRLSKGRPRYKSQQNMGLYQVWCDDDVSGAKEDHIMIGRHHDATIEDVESFLEAQISLFDKA